MLPMTPVMIQAALNGGRSRAECPAVPVAPPEIAEEARRCAMAGASVVHFHAQRDGGGWLADRERYAEAIRRIRAVAPDLLISITSLRPADVSVSAIVELLRVLAVDPATRPDLLSINLGHIVAWERQSDGRGRRTVHYPNGYEEIAALLAACRMGGIVPELGVMDLGFLSNAATLRDDGLLPSRPWFLLELDTPAFGAGRQVAPATVANYDHLAGILSEQFPGSAWAAHGVASPTYPVVLRALASGAHVRVGFEDAVTLPDDRPASSNAELVSWAVERARELRRHPATAAEARAIIGAAH
ncbi:MAG TPA: 3-keto-5-aminohexanoate cleavage protein [Thermomicrobiales bacterium]